MIDIMKISKVKIGCRIKNLENSQSLRLKTMQISSDMKPHLLISAIISVGDGLNFDLISACKSGKNPSTTIQMINDPNPIILDYFVFYCV